MLKTSNNHGFNLVELMITIALLAIVATIAVPNFVQFIRNNQVQAKADELGTFLQYARSQAVAKRESYTVNLTTWKIYPASNASEVERELDINAAQATISNLSGTPDVLTFSGQGMASSTVKLSVCRDTDAANGYLLEILPSGLVKRYQRGKKDDSNALTSCTRL